LKSQLQDTEKQLLRYQQNEQKLKIECEHTRAQLNQTQLNETTLKTDLINSQKKVSRAFWIIIKKRIVFFFLLNLKFNQFCINLWSCFTDNDEYNENEEEILEQIRQIKQDLQQSKVSLEEQNQKSFSTNQTLETTFNQISDLIVGRTRLSIDMLFCSSSISENNDQRTNKSNKTRRCSTTNHRSSNRHRPRKYFRNFQTNKFICHWKLSSIDFSIQSTDTQRRRTTTLYFNFIWKKTNRRNLFFALAIREYFDSIRQQIDELQREKQNLSLEQISREQTYQSELEQIATDKE